MGGFAVEPLRLAFNIPQDVALMAVIAVGYQANPDVLEEGRGGVSWRRAVDTT